MQGLFINLTLLLWNAGLVLRNLCVAEKRYSKICADNAGAV